MSKKEIAIESYGGVGDHEVGNNLTGSAHTLKVTQVQDGVRKDLAKIGIDCGGYQGANKLTTDFAEYFRDMAALIITHAHFDHVGSILQALKYMLDHKVRFPIFATRTTIKAAEKILLDSVAIEQKRYDAAIGRAKSIWKVISQAHKAIRRGRTVSKDGKGNRIIRTQSHEEINNFDIHEAIFAKHHLDPSDPNLKKTWFDRIKKPEFSEKDVKEVISMMRPWEIKDGRLLINGYDQEEIGIQFFNAGHIPGSIGVLVDVETPNEKAFRAFFSGDIGSYDWEAHPSGVITPPRRRDLETSRRPGERDDRLDIDAVVIETTYGGQYREHESVSYGDFVQQVRSDLQDYNELFLSAFSMDRSQKFITLLVQMKMNGDIPGNIPLYFDSKLGHELIPIFVDQAKETLEEYREHLGDQLPGGVSRLKAISMLEYYIEFLNPSNKHYTIIDAQTRDEYLSLPGKKIIVTSGGMMEGGPIQGYLARNWGNEKAMFYGLGYAAEGTIAHALETRNQKTGTSTKEAGDVVGASIRIEDKVYLLQDLRAGYRRIRGFSGHAHQGDSLKVLQQMPLAENAMIIGVHGDTQSTTRAFGDAIHQHTPGEFRIAHLRRPITFTL